MKRTFLLMPWNRLLLHGHKGLEIGDYSLLAQNITITPYSHKFDNAEKIIYSQGGFTRKVSIGRDCYIGMNVCILYSGDIGDGSVIGDSRIRETITYQGWIFC